MVLFRSLHRWLAFLFALVAWGATSHCAWGQQRTWHDPDPRGERYPLEEVWRKELSLPDEPSREPLVNRPQIARLPRVAESPEPSAGSNLETLPPPSGTNPPPEFPPPGDDPAMDCSAARSTYFRDDFTPDPINYQLPFDACAERSPYETKQAIRTQRPWLELGRPFYDWGPFPPSSAIFGSANLASPQFLVYGDFRSAIASRKSNGIENNQLASRLNLEADLKLTSTERLHTSMQPLNRNGNFTHLDFNSQDAQFFQAFNANLVTGFLEADLGAIWGGLTGQVLPFELPVAVGVMPLLFQNGIWLEDNVVGAAVSLPAKNSRALDIANFDVTFFYLFDNINSPAFQGDNSAAKSYGVASFFDVADGYIECDYAYLEDRSSLHRSYHNVGLSYTRRYASVLSNSVRMITNLGQDPQGIQNTADGVLLLVENSLITDNPYLYVPYFNFFAGFRQPQSVARNAAAGGILRNTGILFESDNLTGYPTLDASGNEAYGGALGVNMIPATINKQLVLEYAFVNVMNDVAFRKAAGNQQGLGVRYQHNLSNSWLLRADAMYGFFDNAPDVAGVRLEARHKF